METLKAKWQEMGLYRRILLAVMLAEIVGFLIANVIVVNRPGLEYGGRPALSPARRGRLQIYEGKLDGEPARFAVSPEGGNLLPVGGVHLRPLPGGGGPRPPCPETLGEHDGKDNIGLEIPPGRTQVLFRGGPTAPETPFSSPDATRAGEPLRGITCLCLPVSEGTATLGDVNGQEASAREERHEPGLAALARVVLTPELTHQGKSAPLVWHAPCIALLNLFQICFPHFFFRLGLRRRVRNVDDAVEPSDCYIAMEKHRVGRSGHGPVPGAVRHGPDVKSCVTPPSTAEISNDLKRNEHAGSYLCQRRPGRTT